MTALMVLVIVFIIITVKNEIVKTLQTNIIITFGQADYKIHVEIECGIL